jgi:hypothetical protein
MAQLHYVRPQKVSTNQVARTMLVMLCGLATSLLTAFALAFIELRTEVALYTFSVWIIIPVGALISGAIAASGYWAGARFLSIRPNRSMLAGVVVISFLTWLTTQWLVWFMLEIDGTRLRDIISFLPFIMIFIESTSLSIEGMETGELGRLGYLYTLLQVIGFSTGGWSVYWWLRRTPWCEDCSVYMSEQPAVLRSAAQGEPIELHVKQILELLSTEKYREAVKTHLAFGQPFIGGQELQTSLQLASCPRCKSTLLHYAVEAKDDQGKYQIMSETEVEVRSSDNLQAVVDEANFLAAASKAA